MFHYRWKYDADIHKASHVLALDRDPHHESVTILAKMSSFFAERQIERLRVVGSNDVTTPVIEDELSAASRACSIRHLVSGQRLPDGRAAGRQRLRASSAS